MDYRVLRMGLYGLLAVGALLAAGCGGGGGTTVNSVQGVVADGYLEDAKVFLDLNDDKQFTEGEPTAMTAADGSYTITGVSDADLSAHALVVSAQAGLTKNHEGSTATTLTDSYVLSTPPNAPKTADGQVVITPLTTLIHNQIETNPVLDVAAAEAVVKTNLGVADATSLFDDFVQKKGASTEYEKVSQVAQVIASAIGSNMAAVSAAAPTADINDVIKMVVAEVVAQLTTISTAVDTAAQGGNFDPATVATSTVTIDTNDGEALQASLDQAATAPVVGSFQTALGTDGFFYLDVYSDYGMGMTYEYGKVMLGDQGSDGFALTEDFFSYDTLNSNWAAATEEEDNYVLSKTGWVPEDDAASAGKLVFNADGTATWTKIETGDSEIITVSKMDVAGKGIASFIAKQSSPINAGAVFPAGSEAYKMTFTRKSDNYSVWMGGYPNSMLMDVAKVSDIPARFTAGSNLPYGLGIGRELSVTFSGSGTNGELQFISGAGPLSLKGTWKIVEPVAGFPVLVLDVPLSYRMLPYMDYSPEKIIFALVDGSIRQGEVEYANVPRVESGFNFNKTAFDAILANFNPSQGNIAPKTAAKTMRKKY